MLFGKTFGLLTNTDCQRSTKYDHQDQRLNMLLKIRRKLAVIDAHPSTKQPQPAQLKLVDQPVQLSLFSHELSLCSKHHHHFHHISLLLSTTEYRPPLSTLVILEYSVNSCGSHRTSILRHYLGTTQR